MKTASDDLYNLIHALNPSEKGYFKKFSKRHTEKDSDYLLLFNAIEKQPAYNEKALKHIKDLAGNKHRLYDLILNSLLIYSAGSASVNFMLDKNVLLVKILAYHRLTNQALKLVRKSIEMAAANESYDQAGFLSGMEIDLMMHVVTEDKIWDLATTRYKKMTDFYNKSMNVDRMLSEQKKVGFALDLKKTGKSYKQYLQHIDINFLTNKRNSLTERSEIFRLAVLFMYYDLMDDTKNHLKYARESLKLNEKLHEKYYPARMHIYIAALHNYCIIMAKGGNWKEMKLALDKLSRLNPESAILRYKQEFIVVMMSQLYLWHKGEFEKGIDISEAWIKKAKKVGADSHSPEYELRLNKQLALLYFVTGQYQQAYLLVQDIYTHSKSRQDIETCRQADLLIILIQVELQNFTILNGLLKAFKKRYLTSTSQSRGLLSDFTGALLKYPKLNGQAFSKLVAGNNDLLFFELLHLSDWLQSKAGSKPLVTIIATRNSTT